MRQCLQRLGLRRLFSKGDIVNHSDYLVEAAEALDAPGEIWLFRDKISLRSRQPGMVLLRFSGQGIEVYRRNQVLDL